MQLQRLKKEEHKTGGGVVPQALHLTGLDEKVASLLIPTVAIEGNLTV